MRDIKRLHEDMRERKKDRGFPAVVGAHKYVDVRVELDVHPIEWAEIREL
jgi:hypothetical protein